MVVLPLIGEEREDSGSTNSKALRKIGKIPAVVYGFNENYKLSISYKDFLKEYLKGSILSKLVDIKLKKKTLKAIPREVQTDPVTDNPIHVDFQLIKDDIPVKVAVLAKVINQDSSPGIKRGGILNVVKKYINFNCIPRNIPASLQIDISGFEIGRSVHIHDIKLPNGVAPVSKDNFTVLTITGRVEDKEEEKTQEADVNESKEKKSESK
jgi:large subunit ribosomal protein L25